MTLALSELRDRVYALCMDSARTYIDPSEVDDWLNEAYIDVAVRLKLIKGTASGTTSAGGLITLPADSSELIALRLPNLPDDIEFVDNKTFLETKDTNAYVFPTQGRVFNGQIELIPAPSTGTAYELKYVKVPTALSADEDVTLLPREVDQRLVWYALAFAKLKEGEMGQHDRFFNMYEMGLPPSPLGLWKDRPGPMTLVPDDDHWDF